MTIKTDKHHNCPTCRCTDPLDPRILSAIEEGGDAFAGQCSDHDTSPGVTAEPVDPATIRAKALREALAVILPIAERNEMPGAREAWNAVSFLIDKEQDK